MCMGQLVYILTNKGDMIMGDNEKQDFDEKAFVKGAYKALIDRGVITEE